MKTLIVILIVASCGIANAGTRVVPNETSTAIITPDTATAHRRFGYYLLTAAGDFVVCPNNDWYSRDSTCKDYSGANQWKLLKDAVPKGRTFVGYSIDSYRDAINVYWK